MVGVAGAAAFDSTLAGSGALSPEKGSSPSSGRAGASGAASSRRAQRDHEGAGVPRSVSRALTEVVEVVPKALKVLLAGLAALAVILLAAWALAAARARRLGRQRRALLADVGALQGALLPTIPGRIGALDVSAAYRPADGPVAGGDFYDVFPLPDGGVGLVVGDLSGHGRDALAPTAFLRYTLRAHMEAGAELREVLKLTEDAFERAPVGDEPGPSPTAPTLSPGGSAPSPRRFATVLVAVYDPAARTLSYAGAGHPPPIVAGPDARRPITAASAPPLGLGMETGTRQTTISLPRGAVACLYTDGLPEARAAGRMLGDERLAELVEELGPEEGAEELVRRIAAEADVVPDDLAVCLVRPLRPSAAPWVRVEELEVGPGEADAAGRFLDACGLTRDESAAALGQIAATLAHGERALLRVDLTGSRRTVEAFTLTHAA